MANSRSFIYSRIVTRSGFSFLVAAIFSTFVCASSVQADYDAATADLSAEWTITSSNGITLDGNVLSYANHTGTLAKIDSDPTITLTNGAVFEQSGNFVSGNRKAIVVRGGGTLKITSAGTFNNQTDGLWGFYLYDGSVVDTTGAGFMCFYGQADALQLHDNSEFIVGTNFWTKRNSVVHVYSGADAKFTQSTAPGISDVTGLNLSSSGSITFTVDENAYLTSTVRIYDEGSTNGFTKNGAGTMTILNANNDFKKGTTISAGKLVLSGAGNLTATSGVSISSGATLEFKDNDSNGEGGTVTFSRVISGAGDLVKSGTGSVNLTATNTYTGTTTISGGTLIADNSSAVGKGALYLDNATFGSAQGSIQSSSVTITGDSTFISTTGWNLVKNFSGSGTLTLTGPGYLAFKDGYSATNYTGSFIVGTNDTAGALALESANIINEAANIRSVNGYVEWKGLNQSFSSFEYLDGEMRSMTGTITLSNEFKYNSSTNLTVPAVIAGSANLVKEGSGALTLSGANSYYGETTVSGGTLIIPRSASLATSKVTVESGATFQTGASLNAAVEINGGTLTLGDMNQPSVLYFNSLSLDNGTINFNLYDSNNYNSSFDNLSISSANLSSGVINLRFLDSSSSDWWNAINDYAANGLTLINGYIENYDNVNNNSVVVNVNGAPTTDWRLTADSSGVYLLPNGSGPAPTGEIWYFANTNDIYEGSWTIDGTNKLGAKFIEGDSFATYTGGVYMNSNGKFEIGAGHNLTIEGEISGSGAVTKTGDGTLTLTNVNTYSGGTTVSGGTLVVENIDAIGTGDLTIDNATISSVEGTLPANSVTITGDSTFISSNGWNLLNNFSGSGTLTLIGYGDGRFTIREEHEATNYTGTFIVGTPDQAGSLTLRYANVLNSASNIRSVNGKIDWRDVNQSFNSFEYLDGEMVAMTGTLTLGNEFKYNSSTDLTVPAIIAGDANLVKEGSGTLTLSTANTYSGTTTISEGALMAENASAVGKGGLYVNNATLGSVQGTLQSSSVTITGDSTFISTTGWNLFKNFSGSGTLTLTGPGYLAFKDGYSATNYAGSFIVGTNDTAGALALESANIVNESANIRSVNGYVEWKGLNQSFSSFEYLDGEMRNMTGTITLSNEFKYNSSTNLTVPAVIAGSANLVKEGSGTLTLSGANSYYGETTVSGGTLIVPRSASLATPRVTVESGATFQTAASLNAAVEINGGTLTLGDMDQPSVLYFNSLSLDNGTINFNLYDSNNYNSSFDNLSVSSANLSSGVINLRFLDSNATDWWNAINDYAANGLTLISGNIENYNNVNNNFVVNVNGAPTTDWRLTADSSGVYLFANGSGPAPTGEIWYFANTNDIYEDSWTIDGTNKLGAKFIEGDSSATYTGGVYMNSNGKFEIGAGHNLTIEGEISGTGAVAKTGDGTLTLTNANTYTGGTTVSGGTLVVENIDAIGTGDLTIDNATISSVEGTLPANNVTITGDSTFISSNGWNLLNNFSGSGTLTLIGYGDGRFTIREEHEATDYTGTFIVGTPDQAGSLTLRYANVLNSASNIRSVNGKIDWRDVNQSFNSFEYLGGEMVAMTGTLTLGNEFKYNSSTDLTVPAIIAGDANLVKEGSGTLTLSAANTYSGTTTISEGALMAENASAVGKGGLYVNNATLGSVQGTLQSSSVTITGDSTFISTTGWNLFKNFSGSGTLTLTGPGYLAFKDGYSATNYTGSFIVGTNETSGALALESANIVNETANIRAVNGYVEWKDLNQSFSSFEYLDGEMRNMTGTITLSNEFKYNSSTNLTVPAVIAGSANLVKEGSGTLTLSGNNTYSGETTVSGGTLIVPRSASLATSKVTIESDATFQTGAYLNGEVDVNNGGNLVVGDMNQSSSVYIGSLSLSGGSISFDLYDSASFNYDKLTVSSASLESGVINLRFIGSSASDWWNAINDYSADGLPLIDGYITDSESFNSDSFSVYINGSPSTDWTLSTGSYGSGLYLLANGSGPTPGGEPWYFANTDDINASSWTIDGANKLGVKLLEGDNHSVTYYNPVEMYSSGIVQVGENYNLTLSGAISGSGALEKTDAGKLTINSANDGFTGETTVSGGTLELSGAGTLGSTTINVGQGATMLYNDTVPHNTSLLTYNVNGGTLEFYNTTPATTHTIDNGICSGIEGQDVVINGTGATILIDGGGTISAIAGSGKSSLTFNLDSNSVIDVNSGMFINGSYQTQNWDNNFATLHIGATGKVDLWDGAQMKVGGLTGEAGANIVNESGKSSCKGISIGNGVTADQTFIYNGAITLNEKAVDYVGAGTQVLNGTLTGVTIQSKSGTLVFGVPGDTMTIKPLSRISTEGGAIRIDGNVRLDDSSSYVLCTGAWTGNGTLTIDNGYLRVGNSFDFTGGITFNGGLILNNDNDATLAADITVTKDGSDIHAGWSKSMVLTGKLKGDKSLTIGSDSGNLRFAGDATEYTGSYLVKGNMRVGVAGTEQVDTTTYLGSSPILLNGGMIQNQDNNITITNDLNFVSDSDLKSGWSKDTTYTGAITGSGRLRVVSDSGWVIMGTSCDGTFTGDVQANWDSTSKMGNIRLAAQQPFGPNAGRANIYGQLDMNGYSQVFKGVISNTDGSNQKGKIFNDTNTLSTLTLDITGKDFSYDGVINGNIELVVNSNGGGTQTFNNKNSAFTGNVVINGGTVATTVSHTSYTTTALGAFSTAGGRTITVNQGAELSLGTNDVLGGCSISNFNENSVRLIVNGGKVSGTNNNPLYNATFQNGAEVYGNNNRDIYRSFWLMGTNTVSFAGDGSAPENPVNFNGADGVIFVLDSAVLNVDDVTKSSAADLVVNVKLGNKSESFVENNSLTKTGAGTVRLTAANEYTGPTTISGGALALASTGSLVSDVTVEPGASFIDAAPSITSNVTVDRGSFVIGDTTSSAQIVIGDLTVYDGSILFDFNDSSSSTDYDRLTAASMTFTTASINVTFNNGDQTDWWNNNTDNGYVLIDTSSLNGSVDNIQLLVNSAATDAWYLDTVGTSIVLKNQNYEPPVTDLYYRANSSDDISDQKWTIDGANKQGVTFTAGDNNTATFAGEVEMNANGSFEVAENKNLKLTGPVTGEGEVEKKGDGTLTLSGNNTYTGKTTVTDGTLTLTGAAVKTNSPIEIAEDATLEYNVPSGQKSLEFNNVNSAVTGSNAIKTGAGTLKILSTDGLFAPDKFAVEAGELDFQGTYNGDIEVKRGATLSAGNSPGDLTVYGDVKIDAGATGLFEFSAFTADKEQQVFDQMFITGASSFILDPGSTIKLSFLNGDAGAWSSAEDAVYQLVFDENFVSETTDLSEFLETKYQGVFALEGTPEGLFLHGLGVIPVPEPGSGVPEPSTWALLLLGAAGLMYWRKKNA